MTDYRRDGDTLIILPKRFIRHKFADKIAAGVLSAYVKSHCFTSGVLELRSVEPINAELVRMYGRVHCLAVDQAGNTSKGTCWIGEQRSWDTEIRIVSNVTNRRIDAMGRLIPA